MTKEELLKKLETDTLNIKMLVNGGFGTGKTYLAMTFPKWEYCQIEPHGLQTAVTNKSLLANMVATDNFTPSKSEDIKDYFDRVEKYIDVVRKKAEDKEIRTFIFDNLSHFSEIRWMYIEKYGVKKTQSGMLNTMGMYGDLTRWLFKFILTEVIALPCHVIIPVHIMEESEEVDGKQQKTGKIISDTLGSFRNSAGGLVNASIFMEIVREKEGKFKYRAQCMPDARREAKNNIGLPLYVENISYETIMKSIAKEN